MSNQAIALLKSARDKALKNRAEAVAKASQAFDKEIEILDQALKQLGISVSRPSTAKKAVKKGAKKSIIKKSPPKKAAPKKKNASKKSTAKKSAPKKAVAKKTIPVKKGPGGYPLSGSIQEKLAHVIGQAKRFLSIAEIGDMVKKAEPGQKVEKIKRRFSKHMDKFRKQGGIVSYSADNKTYYGIPSFLKDGKPMEGHKHKA